MKRLVAALAFAALSAHAQQATVVPIALQVQRLAPQLVAFAGSQGNFENLVNGIALGVPVTLSSVGADGVVQTVTFSLPGGAVSEPAEIARALEGARQQLIARGVATPTAQQLAEQVSGASVPVTVGTLPAPPAGTAAAGAGMSPAQQIQSQNTPVAPQVNTSDNRVLGNTSNSPTPPARQSPPATGSAPSLPPPPRR